MLIRTILLFLILLWCCSCGVQHQEFHFNGSTMGTIYNVKIISDKLAIRTLDQIKRGIDSVLISINQQMSTYMYNSEISAFNNHESTEQFPVSSGFAMVVDRALFWSSQTGGAFDITLVPLLYLWGFGPGQDKLTLDDFPDTQTVLNRLTHVGFNKISVAENVITKSDPFVKLDLNSIAKGHGVDAVFAYIESRNIDNMMVEIGGEVRTKGTNRKNKPWIIAVERPQVSSLNKKEVDWVVELENSAMATSGNYRNFFEIDDEIYSHIIDPRSGYPTKTGIASTTVIASYCMDADALATALMVLTVEDGLQLIESLSTVEACLIIHDGKGDYILKKSSGMQIAEL